MRKGFLALIVPTLAALGPAAESEAADPPDVGDAVSCLADLLDGSPDPYPWECLAFLGAAAGVIGPPNEVGRISETSAGAQATDRDSGDPDMSGDSRYVAFTSESTQFAPDAPFGVSQVYVHDRGTGDTEIVSVDEAGLPGDGDSLDPAISGDGRYVVFRSEAALLPGDANGANDDIYLFDRWTRTAELLSVDAAGDQLPAGSICQEGSYTAISRDANTVAFGVCEPAGEEVSIALYLQDRDGPAVFLRVFDRDEFDMPFTTLVGNIDLSADGDAAVFGLGVNASSRLLLLDRSGEEPVLSAIAFTGGRNPIDNTISEDGSLVAVRLDSPMVPSQKRVWLWDRGLDAETLVSKTFEGAEATGGDPAISGDGRFVAYQSPAADIVEGDENGAMDVFVYDVGADATWIASVNRNGQQTVNEDNANPVFAFSAGAAFDSLGRYLAFESGATNLEAGDTNMRTDVFVGPNPP